MANETVTLAHGAGGTQTAQLIDRVFKAHFENPSLTADDAAVLEAPSPETVFTGSAAAKPCAFSFSETAM